MKEKFVRLRTPLLLLVTALAVAAMAFVFALERVNTCDYVSINGDFQSYNVFRRILAGQAPYRDFANYIGMAPVFLNVPLLALNNTFANSLFITNFTTCIIFCVMVLLFLYLITQNLAFSCFSAALLPKLISSKLLYRLLGQKLGAIYTERFAGLYTPSNSMRGARTFLPFLLVLAALTAVHFIHQKHPGWRLIDHLQDTPVLCTVGALEGFFIVWSNDYSIATGVATFLILILLEAAVYRAPLLRFARSLLIFLATYAAGAAVSVTLWTGFSPLSWLHATGQTGEYQFFYFNGTAGKAILPYIFSVPELLAFTALLIAFWLGCLLLLVRGQADDRLLLLVFITLTICGAAYIYICGGSGYNFRESLEVFSILLVFGMAARGVLMLLRRFRVVAGAVLACGVCLLAGYYSLQLAAFTPSYYGVYMPGLGGYCSFERELIEADAFTGDEAVFSLYATGLEVVKGQFQPTGCDYIIHALGSKTQQHYVDTFVEGSYAYVQTPSMEVGAWLANQNWYFYRQLLGRYRPVFNAGYCWVWEKGETTVDAEVSETVSRLSDTSVEIICTSANTSAFVADLSVCYTTSFDSPLHAFLALGRKAVMADTTCCMDYSYPGVALPADGTANIPVKMEGGQGRAVLRGVYGDGVCIDVESASFVEALPGFYLCPDGQTGAQ